MIAIFYDIVLFSIDFSHKFSFIKKKKRFFFQKQNFPHEQLSMSIFSLNNMKNQNQLFGKQFLFQGNLMENKEKTFRFYRFSPKRTFCLFYCNFLK
jgi:hypothetical protein